ncbi:hypothetical protein GYMLUDRAFT_33347 [Collybiopsis luxurians FD-317 M1]|nr:hypothetical protein GYMLUDRAFT_33347 [Collybiopsis luxurians FD-317 M1]
MSDGGPPTEETGLLDASAVSLPFLQNSISRLDSLSIQEKDRINSEENLRPLQLANHRALTTSFSLLVLLIFREKKSRAKFRHSSPWDQWKQESVTEEWRRAIDENIDYVWTSFLSVFCSSTDIQTALWTDFRMDEKGNPLRVADFVHSHPQLLNDRTVELSMRYRWNSGDVLDLSRSRQYLMPRYDTLCTPWTYHAFDLASQLAFLLLLVSYVLSPPAQSLEYLDTREVVLLIISVSAILHSWSTSAPFAVTLFAFLFQLPSSPSPQDLSFNLLLLALLIHIIQLHIPVFPSPFLLCWPERCLPLAALIVSGVFGTILQAILFFLPVLLLSVYFLSYAMSDVFLLSSFLNLPAPIPTREIFFILAASSFVVTFLSILVLLPSYMSAVSGRSSWDRYSISTGQDARVQFYSAVIRYSKTYPFPPPFNILHFVLITLPAYILPFFAPLSHFHLFSQIVASTSEE